MKDESKTYDHRFHAGNAGDVFKHACLLALLRAAPRPVRYMETHAGAGRYALGATGEHTEGIGRLFDVAPSEAPPAARAYLDAAARDPTSYPGSPLLAAGALGPLDTLLLHEKDQETAEALSHHAGGDARVTVREGDGLAALREHGASFVLVDPTWAEKREWTDVPRALVSAPDGAITVLWYPVKSHTRPNALHAALEKARWPAVAIELLTMPLHLKKNRLNGSGLLIHNAPPSTIPELLALAAWLGPHLATHAWWSTRCVAWGA